MHFIRVYLPRILSVQPHLPANVRLRALLKARTANTPRSLGSSFPGVLRTSGVLTEVNSVLCITTRTRSKLSCGHSRDFEPSRKTEKSPRSPFFLHTDGRYLLSNARCNR